MAGVKAKPTVFDITSNPEGFEMFEQKMSLFGKYFNNKIGEKLTSSITKKKSSSVPSNKQEARQKVNNTSNIVSNNRQPGARKNVSNNSNLVRAQGRPQNQRGVTTNVRQKKVI